jgi:DNA-binding FadR family transcriptional regulator
MNDLDARALTRQAERRPVAAIARPKPLHETVLERLRDMIVEAELASGERLHDANLARILQVSRTPIREATKLLAAEGLVDLLPGRGARVSELSIEDILDLFETIAGIERHACELAAERMSEASTSFSAPTNAWRATMQQANASLTSSSTTRFISQLSKLQRMRLCRLSTPR